MCVCVCVCVLKFMRMSYVCVYVARYGMYVSEAPCMAINGSAMYGLGLQTCCYTVCEYAYKLVVYVFICI